MLSASSLELATFLLGLLLGSFLNVCISRLPRGESVARGRSHCAQCGHTIRWHDNIPLLSWFLLRAKCRDCDAVISWRYPLVELSSGLWLALVTGIALHGWQFGQGAGPSTDQLLTEVPQVLGIAALGLLLIALLVIDWQTQTLPDALTFSGIFTGLVLTCVQAAFLAPGTGDIHLVPRRSLRMSSPGSFTARGDVFLTGPEALILGRVAAILAAAGVLLLIRATYKALRGREGMGLGDAKLLGMIAAFLGFGDAMLSFFFGMIACAAYAVYLLMRGRATPTTKLALGSFLAAGGLATALVGQLIVTWYKGLL